MYRDGVRSLVVVSALAFVALACDGSDLDPSSDAEGATLFFERFATGQVPRSLPDAGPDPSRRRRRSRSTRRMLHRHQGWRISRGSTEQVRPSSQGRTARRRPYRAAIDCDNADQFDITSAGRSGRFTARYRDHRK